MKIAVNEGSPCRSCTRVRDPQNCENKNCRSWQSWFIRRWDQIRTAPRQQVDATRPCAAGVNIGGQHYAMPHQVRQYLQDDPCESCVCPRELCDTPCRVRRIWEKTRNEVGV